MKILNNVKLNSFSKEYTNRFDYNYISYLITNNENKNEKVSLLDISKVIEPDSINIEELGEFKYCQISDVDSDGFTYPVIIDFENQRPELSDYYKKIEKGDIFKPQKGDVLISKIRPYLKEIVYIDDSNEDIYFTKAFILLRPLIDSRLFYGCIRSSIFKDLNSISRTGKGYPTLNPKDLAYVFLDRESIDKLNKSNNSGQISAELIKSDAEIKKLLSNKKDDSAIINDAIIKYFGYNINKFNSLKNKKIYTAKFNQFGNNIDCRFSSKFHRPAGEFVYNEIISKPYYLLKEVVEIPIITGQGISDEFDENGDYYYISMADISKWKIDYDNLKSVENNYSNSHLSKKVKGISDPVSTIVEKNDVLMMRSGEGGIGKVAISDEDVNAIFCDFIIRFRFNKDLINPKFAYYYFRSQYFQYMIEINKKGLGNNTNIFPNNLQDFPIPNISIEEQKGIVYEIDKELKQQREIINSIETIMKRMDRLICSFI